MKYFPIILHIILTFVVIGLAVGLKADGVRMVYQYTANGLAVGLAFTAFLRVMLGSY